MSGISGYKYLGYENGWNDVPPPEIVLCEKSNHKLEVKENNTTCDHTFICHVCKHYWKLDSGD